MKLPNANGAVVAQAKIRDYLLNPAHPDNGGKAAFFISLGFDREGAAVLADSFKELARHADVSAKLDSPHGQKYVLDGCLGSPSGRSATIRTIWIVDRGEDIPRLVTAYPHEE